MDYKTLIKPIESYSLPCIPDLPISVEAEEAKKAKEAKEAKVFPGSVGRERLDRLTWPTISAVKSWENMGKWFRRELSSHP